MVRVCIHRSCVSMPFVVIILMAFTLIALISLLLSPDIMFNYSSVKANDPVITFNIASNQYISASYSPTIDVSSGTVAPGSNATVTISLSGSTMLLTINVPSFTIAGYTIGGGSVTIPVDPLGDHEYPLPDLSFSFPGLSGGVYLDVIGQVTGTVVVSGNGTGPTGEVLTWTSEGPQTIQVRAFNVPSGEITVSLENIRYTISIALYAKYSTVFGSGTYTILQPTTIGTFQGNPSTVSGVYYIEKPTIIGPVMATGLLSMLLKYAPYIALAVIVIAVVSYVGARRRGKVRRPRQAAPQAPIAPAAVPVQQSTAAQATLPSIQAYGEQKPAITQSSVSSTRALILLGFDDKWNPKTILITNNGFIFWDHEDKRLRNKIKNIGGVADLIVTVAVLTLLYLLYYSVKESYTTVLNPYQISPYYYPYYNPYYTPPIIVNSVIINMVYAVFIAIGFIIFLIYLAKQFSRFLKDFMIKRAIKRMFYKNPRNLVVTDANILSGIKIPRNARIIRPTSIVSVGLVGVNSDIPETHVIFRATRAKLGFHFINVQPQLIQTLLMNTGFATKITEAAIIYIKGKMGQAMQLGRAGAGGVVGSSATSTRSFFEEKGINATPSAPPPPPPTPPPQIRPYASVEKAGSLRGVSQPPVAFLVLPSGLAFRVNLGHVFGRRDFEGLLPREVTQYISARHFRVFYKNGQWFIEDLGSTNGTLVNGIEIKGIGPIPIKDGDTINPAGTVNLTFKTH